MPGTLYLVATPIGNLDDMTPRAAATFGAVDFIAAEDTRVTLRLLNHLGLKKPLVSYYEHALQKGEAILQRIEAGESCALCSDAGMPCISDPGEVIVRDAMARGIPVVPIPAASACVTALAVSGQKTDRFVFEGFLPMQKKDRRARLDRDIPRQEQALADTVTRRAAAQADMARHTASAAELEKQIGAMEKKLRFDGKASAAREQARLAQELNAMEQALKKAVDDHTACEKKRSTLAGQIGQLRLQLADTPVIDAEAQAARKAELEAKKQAILRDQKTVHARRSANESARRSILAKAGELTVLEEKLSWMRALSATANGQISGKEKLMLETYIQTTYFDRIVARANLRLMTMTGGQYDLKRRRTAQNNQSQSGLELDVIDHYNGTERSVRTLSGGESFKASLALALGLSDEVQMSTGIRLDTLFVDEGFGSLDPESLDQAYRTLAGLTEGNRLVGIISHVAELKEKIDRQIVVTKDRSGGSRAEIRVS